MIRIRILGLLAILAATIVATGCGTEDDHASVRVSTEGGGDGNDTTIIRDIDTTVIRNIDTTILRDVDTVVKTEYDTVKVPKKTNPPPTTVTAEERRQIDLWLTANSDSLNQFGDSKDRMYTGGTPLFNEATGKQIDRYQYIIGNHPDRPWRKM